MVVATAVLAALVGACTSRQPFPLTLLSRVHAAPERQDRAVGGLDRSLSRIFDDPEVANTVWGVHIRSVDRDETLYQLNDRTPLIPASAAKILTLATAASRLGWDYRYQTDLLSEAAIDDGALQGNLVVRGSGDPSIHAPDGPAADLFSSWATELMTRGIQRIDGRLIGDDDALDGGEAEPWIGLGVGWAWNDLGFGFATPGGALQYRENVVELTVRPGRRAGDPVTAQIDELSSGLELVNHMVTGEFGSDSTFTLNRLPGQDSLVLGGSIGAGTSALRRLVSVDNPTAYFVKSLRAALAVGGISVSGDAVDIDDLPRETPALVERPLHRLATHASPPLSELAVDMMKNSQNLYAETILRTLGAQASDGSTTIPGQEVIGDLLESWHITPDQFVIADGSGLSRDNLVTAAALAAVLQHIQLDPRDAELFEGTLPVAGRDGTLMSRMLGTAAEGNARAKTGSMTSVRTLAGYVETRDGERLAFAILANNFLVRPTQILNTVDRAVATLAAFSRR